MRVIIVGLGIQGRKRLAVAGEDAVASVDPVISDAGYQRIEQVGLDKFDCALVCTPDHTKLDLLRYLLGNGKHVLVEKPLLLSEEQVQELADIARSKGAVCYTAYNHRFEPHIVNMKRVLDAGTIGCVYLARCFYGNGTAFDVKNSSWRDQGMGVLPDLGSHLLDIALFLFGKPAGTFKPWSFNRFENRAFDHMLFGSSGKPVIELEGTLLSWRNTFTLDVFGELGSVHINGLCKWGPSKLIVRKRILPSGRPIEDVQTLECPDPTWKLEYEYFKQLCKIGGANIENDRWIGAVLKDLTQSVGQELLEESVSDTFCEGKSV